MQDNIHFLDALSAQNFAKENPGTVITRTQNGDSYIVTGKAISHQSITPQSIHAYLNDHVIAQEDAKEEVALALYYHHIKYQKRFRESVHNNGPVMLVGPTGTGKTFIVQKACECIGIPFIHVNTASMVPEGIVGYCMSHLMAEILERSGYDISKAEHAVVFFDEVDKLFHNDKESEYSKKIAQQMLRMIEGDRVKFSSAKKSGDKKVYNELNTSNMQFIFGGAFQWLLDEKDRKAPVMGFASQKKEVVNGALSIEDLYAGGVAKEFLGRVSTVVNLQPLSSEEIYAVLSKSKSSPIPKYIEKVITNGAQVAIPSWTYKKIAMEAANHPLGVRSLDFILKRLFKKALFESPLHPGETYVITYQ